MGSVWCREMLAMLVEMAPALRAAGVERFNLDVQTGGMTVRLAPHEPPPAQQANRVDDEREPADPLDDPATYGRRSGVPGFTREPREPDDG